MAELETKLNRLSNIEQKHHIEKRQDKDKGYILVGDLLICWGHAVLQAPAGGPHLRSFDFEFPRAFTDLPTVTTGFDQESVQNALGVYNSKLTATRFSGDAYDNRSSAEAPGAIHRVRMSYTAIGKPKASP
jgi:hypothetical protein